MCAEGILVTAGNEFPPQHHSTLILPFSTKPAMPKSANFICIAAAEEVEAWVSCASSAVLVRTGKPMLVSLISL